MVRAALLLIAHAAAAQAADEWPSYDTLLQRVRQSPPCFGTAHHDTRNTTMAYTHGDRVGLGNALEGMLSTLLWSLFAGRAFAIDSTGVFATACSAVDCRVPVLPLEKAAASHTTLLADPASALPPHLYADSWHMDVEWFYARTGNDNTGTQTCVLRALGAATVDDAVGLALHAVFGCPRAPLLRYLAADSEFVGSRSRLATAFNRTARRDGGAPAVYDAAVQLRTQFSFVERRGAEKADEVAEFVASPKAALIFACVEGAVTAAVGSGTRSLYVSAGMFPAPSTRRPCAALSSLPFQTATA